MHPAHGEVTVGSATLSYEVHPASQPDAPTVVLLHGFSFDRRMWDDQMPVLSPAYRVIRYDLRGFGKSTPGSEPFSHAADLAALLDHLHVERAAVIGLSMGGGAAINFAITHPTRVQALVLADATLGGFAWGPDYGATQKAMREAGKRGVQLAREVWLGLPLFEPAMTNPTVASWIHSIVEDYSGWHWQHPDLGKPLRPAAIHRLGSISVPTLVIVGERDLPDYRRIADTLERGIPGAKKLVLPGVGHMSNLEAPTTFNRQVFKFLEGVTRPRTPLHLEA